MDTCFEKLDYFTGKKVIELRNVWRPSSKTFLTKNKTENKKNLVI